jgi:hypothetical protein
MKITEKFYSPYYDSSYAIYTQRAIEDRKVEFDMFRDWTVLKVLGGTWATEPAPIK